MAETKNGKLEKGASKMALDTKGAPGNGAGNGADSEDEDNAKGGSDSDDDRKKKDGKRGKKKGGADEGGQKEGSYELISKWLLQIDKTIDKIMDNGQTLPPAAWEDLRAMRLKVEGVQKAIERSDVAALLELEKVNWDWATEKGVRNEKVAYYRAAAMKTDHKKFEFRQWHMPQYFSDAPLPPHAYDKNALINATVKLPAELNPTMERTKVTIGVADTAVKVICSLFTKLRVPIGENDYVLKARATNEYMEGAKIMFNYAYVRRCIRDAFEIEFSLVKRPLPPIPTEEMKYQELVKEYKARIDPKIVPLAEGDFQKLNLGGADWSAMKEFPMAQLNVPFRVMVQGIENCVSAALPRLGAGHADEVYVESFLFHGMQRIESSVATTSKVDLQHSPRFMQWLGGQSPDTLLSALPRETKIAFLLWGKTKADPKAGKDDVKEKPQLIGWVCVPLLNERGALMSGQTTLRLWGIAASGDDDHGHGKKRNPADEPDFIFRATTREENCKRAERAVLRLDFGKFVLPVVAPLTPEPREADVKVVGAEKKVGDMKSAEKAQYDAMLQSDTLEKLTPDHKRILWTWRHSLKQHPKMLPKFLQSVNWGSRDCQLEALKLMNQWTPPSEHVHALQLLDARFPDYKVREYAVNVVGRMRDNELALYLLQLVQCLKFEPYHDSPLTRFLIERAIANPLEVGHPLFWHLKAEMHNPEWCERFGLLIEEYLSHAGPAASHLRKQLMTVHKLQKVAEMVVRLKPTYRDEDLRAECRKELEKLNKDFFGPMNRFQIPFNPKLEATTLVVEKCRYMSSKMVPLWLLFKNTDTDAPPVYVLFKSGDDLRQDILTLQLLRVMDATWLQNKCDLKMRPYAVCATGVNSHGKGVGMLEIVTNSDTTAGIQNDFGGGAMGALKSAPIDDFIRHHNKENYEKAVETFLRSCAGYCVATYVLGIGDRHNGNIMVTKTGSLFHIDFGHFLGNFKKKKIAGVNFEREKAAFVFTKAMAFVMGGQEFRKSPLFQRFLKFCFEAFKTLRRNADTLENLFLLMIPAGMPELIVEQDIVYMRNKLALQATESKAEEIFKKEVDIALDHTYRAIDNMIHIWKNA